MAMRATRLVSILALFFMALGAAAHAAEARRIVTTDNSDYFGFDLRTVGDMGQLPSDLSAFALPDVPLNLDTLKIILPYSLTLAMVGLLESLMTAAIVDETTEE